MKLINLLKLPCCRCPYKLGLIHTFVNPCPECKKNGYKTFGHFSRRQDNNYLIKESKDKK